MAPDEVVIRVGISGGRPGALWDVHYGWRPMKWKRLLEFLVAALVPYGRCPMAGAQ